MKSRLIALLLCCIMWAFWPMRLLGLMGAPGRPVLFKAGERVPWWLQCRWPVNWRVEFGVDVQTWFDGEKQILCPMRSLVDGEWLIKVGFGDGEAVDVRLHGAPTWFYSDPADVPGMTCVNGVWQFEGES